MTRTRKRLLIGLTALALVVAALLSCFLLFWRVRDAQELPPPPSRIYVVDGEGEIELSRKERDAVYGALITLLPNTKIVEKDCQGTADLQANKELTLCLRFSYRQRQRYEDGFALLGDQPFDTVTLCVWSDALGLAAGMEGEPFDPERSVRLAFDERYSQETLSAYPTFKMVLGQALAPYGQRLGEGEQMLHPVVVQAASFLEEPDNMASTFCKTSYSCSLSLSAEQEAQVWKGLGEMLTAQGGYLTETADAQEAPYVPGPNGVPTQGWRLELKYDTCRYFFGRVAQRVTDGTPTYREMTLEYDEVVLVLEESLCRVYIRNNFRTCQVSGLGGPYTLGGGYAAFFEMIKEMHQSHPH